MTTCEAMVEGNTVYASEEALRGPPPIWDRTVVSAAFSNCNEPFDYFTHIPLAYDSGTASNDRRSHFNEESQPLTQPVTHQYTPLMYDLLVAFSPSSDFPFLVECFSIWISWSIFAFARCLALITGCSLGPTLAFCARASTFWRAFRRSATRLSESTDRSSCRRRSSSPACGSDRGTVCSLLHRRHSRHLARRGAA